MGCYRDTTRVVALFNHAMKLRQILFAFVALATLGAGRVWAAPQAVTATPGAAASPAQPVLDDDGPPRLSLPTESDRAVWKNPGFRFGLGLVYSRYFGIDGPPSGTFIGPTIRLGLRLDERWSLMGSLQYLFARSGPMMGVRYAGTIEPTWHATEHLSLTVGIGFGGLVTSSNRVDPAPKSGSLDTSYTFPNAQTPLAGCNGVGVTGLLRADWMMVLGPRASTGVALETDAQWTGCVDDSGNVESDTARPIVRRQWWGHAGGSLAWVILWR